MTRHLIQSKPISFYLSQYMQIWAMCEREKKPDWKWQNSAKCWEGERVSGGKLWMAYAPLYHSPHIHSCTFMLMYISSKTRKLTLRFILLHLPSRSHQHRKVLYASLSLTSLFFSCSSAKIFYFRIPFCACVRVQLFFRVARLYDYCECGWKTISFVVRAKKANELWYCKKKVLHCGDAR
jgi:hypothetical protein